MGAIFAAIVSQKLTNRWIWKPMSHPELILPLVDPHLDATAALLGFRNLFEKWKFLMAGINNYYITAVWRIL